MHHALGKLALITKPAADDMQWEAITAAQEFVSLGENTTIRELLIQFKHCGELGCSTPEWEGTLFSIGLIKNHDFLLNYIQTDNSFVKDIIRNTHYYKTGETPLINKIIEILKAKPLPQYEGINDETLKEYMQLGNLSNGFSSGDYNPYYIRHKKLRTMGIIQK